MTFYSYKRLVQTDPEFRELLRFKRLPYVREVIKGARFRKPSRSQYELCQRHIQEHLASVHKHRSGERRAISGTVISINRKPRNKAYDMYYLLKDEDGYTFGGVVPKAIRNTVRIGDTVFTVADTKTVKYSSSLRLMSRPTRTQIL